MSVHKYKYPDRDINAFPRTGTSIKYWECEHEGGLMEGGDKRWFARVVEIVEKQAYIAVVQFTGPNTKMVTNRRITYRHCDRGFWTTHDPEGLKDNLVFVRRVTEADIPGGPHNGGVGAKAEKVGITSVTWNTVQTRTKADWHR